MPLLEKQNPAKSRSRLNPDERRSQLLDCAIRLFADKGIGEAKHAAIAKHGGVSVATTFVYFPTREELVDAVLAEVAREQIGIFDAANAEGLQLSELLHQLADLMITLVDARPHYAKVWLGWSTNFEKRARAAFLKVEGEIVSRLAALLSHAHDANEEASRDNARILMAASANLLTMKLDGISADRMQRFTDHTIDVVLAHARK